MFKSNYGYTQTADSPCPEIVVQISTPYRINSGTTIISCRAIIDSGSPITCIPEVTINQLKEMGASITSVGEVRVGGVTSKKGENKSLFRMAIKIEGCIFSPIKVIALNRPYVLIGRDIINGFEVRLDAPNYSWEANGIC